MNKVEEITEETGGKGQRPRSGLERNLASIISLFLCEPDWSVSSLHTSPFPVLPANILPATLLTPERKDHRNWGKCCQRLYQDVRDAGHRFGVEETE